MKKEKLKRTKEWVDEGGFFESFLRSLNGVNQWDRMDQQMILSIWLTSNAIEIDSINIPLSEIKSIIEWNAGMERMTSEHWVGGRGGGVGEEAGKNGSSAKIFDISFCFVINYSDNY